ncbi:MAG: hypothetical protein AVDCRST_MAG41-1603, partial [uncultured Corynebacteriales bacterium]
GTAPPVAGPRLPVEVAVRRGRRRGRAGGVDRGDPGPDVAGRRGAGRRRRLRRWHPAGRGRGPDRPALAEHAGGVVHRARPAGGRQLRAGGGADGPAVVDRRDRTGGERRRPAGRPGRLGLGVLDHLRAGPGRGPDAGAGRAGDLDRLLPAGAGHAAGRGAAAARAGPPGAALRRPADAGPAAGGLGPAVHRAAGVGADQVLHAGPGPDDGGRQLRHRRGRHADRAGPQGRRRDRVRAGGRAGRAVQLRPHAGRGPVERAGAAPAGRGHRQHPGAARQGRHPGRVRAGRVELQRPAADRGPAGDVPAGRAAGRGLPARGAGRAVGGRRRARGRRGLPQLAAVGLGAAAAGRVRAAPGGRHHRAGADRARPRADRGPDRAGAAGHPGGPGGRAVGLAADHPPAVHAEPGRRVRVDGGPGRRHREPDPAGPGQGGGDRRARVHPGPGLDRAVGVLPAAGGRAGPPAAGRARPGLGPGRPVPGPAGRGRRGLAGDAAADRHRPVRQRAGRVRRGERVLPAGRGEHRAPAVRRAERGPRQHHARTAADPAQGGVPGGPAGARGGAGVRAGGRPGRAGPDRRRHPRHRVRRRGPADHHRGVHQRGGPAAPGRV